MNTALVIAIVALVAAASTYAGTLFWSHKAGKALEVLALRAQQTPPPKWWESLQEMREQVDSALLASQANLQEAEQAYRRARSTEERVRYRKQREAEDDDDADQLEQVELLKAAARNGELGDWEESPSPPAAGAPESIFDRRRRNMGRK